MLLTMESTHKEILIYAAAADVLCVCACTHSCIHMHGGQGTTLGVYLMYAKDWAWAARLACQALLPMSNLIRP